jgi:uncharacterized membrane protein
MKGLCLIVFCCSLSIAQACGDGGDSLPEVDCSGTIPTYSHIKTTSFAKCTICHASAIKGAARVDAPASINFDMYADAKAEAKGAASEVNGGAMPPAGYPKLSDEEKQALYKWALCGTPE